MRTLAVVARKGGSGKTTLTVHLAIAAHLASRRTRVLDTDPQMSAVEVFRMRGEDGPECRPSTPAGLVAAQVDARTDGIDALLIDTPAGTEEGMSNAIVLADLTLLVVRPTFLDLSAAAYTVDILKRLRRPYLAILNQAPVAREGVEPAAVKKAHEVLKLMRVPVAPQILRARASYQTTVENGASAVEALPGSPGARELADLWTYIEGFAFPRRSPAPSMLAAE